MRFAAACLLLGMLAACGPASPVPATLDTRNDACGTCRMTVSIARYAGQIVAPGEEPVFFDDIGCLSRYLRDRSDVPRGAVAYVADHRTGEWARADSAVFTKVVALETPMGSHLIAHATAASRDADPAARDGVAVTREQVSDRLAKGGSR